MEEAKASAFSPDLFKHICYFVDRAVIPRGRKIRFARTHKGGEQSDLENLSTRSMSAGGDESAFRSGPWSSVKSLEKDVFRSAMSSLFRSVFCPAQTGDRQQWDDRLGRESAPHLDYFHDAEKASHCGLQGGEGRRRLLDYLQDRNEDQS